MTFQTTTQFAKGTADVGALGITIATFFEMLPNIAALLSVIWLVLRIWADPTFQSLLEKFKSLFRKI